MYPDGGAHACGPIEWGPAEKRATFEVFLVQEDAVARGSVRVNKSKEMWELHADATEGRMTAGPAIGFGLARIEMESEQEDEVITTVHWSDSLTLVEETE